MKRNQNNSAEFEQAIKADDISAANKFLEQEIRQLMSNKLFAAIDGGAVQVLKFLLEKGANANFSDRFEGSALSYAIKKGNIDCIKLLLEHGADPNKLGWTEQDSYLTTAVKVQNIQLVELLLKYKVDLEGGGKRDKPLKIAIEKNLQDFVKILLEHGADPDCAGDAFFHKPLYLAQDKPLIKELLLKHGAKVEEPSEQKVQSSSMEAQDLGGIIAGGKIVINCKSFKNTGSVLSNQSVKISADTIEDQGGIKAPQIMLNQAISSLTEEVSLLGGGSSLDTGLDAPGGEEI